MKLSAERVDSLNRECDCTLTDMSALRQRIDAELVEGGQSAPIIETHPYLFSDAPVFLKPAHARQMQQIIESVSRVVHLAGYRHLVSLAAPSIAQAAQQTEGVFQGFDFHISPEGAKLIEINTNAGGAMLNVAAIGAQRACCDGVRGLMSGQPTAPELEQRLFEMFMCEWRAARGDQPLGSIAIIDDAPATQYLYPEFLLARRLFESRGIETLIADAEELAIREGVVTCGGRRVDLVYNRLTDFYFAASKYRVLREAYLRNLAVITPHPRAHALFANKRNLALLSDATALRDIGAASADIDVLVRGIPRTVAVEGCEDEWWRERKGWFFKPDLGFGSRGTYRGDKITRRVFSEVMNGQYVAQELTPPGERVRTVSGDKRSYKVDIRCYVYAGEMRMVAARLYQGQTTNFRTAGGGFACVFVVRD